MTGEPLDLDAIEAKWLQTCPSCDAGLPMSCIHPMEDYRALMSDLVDEVRRLRDEVARLDLVSAPVQVGDFGRIAGVDVIASVGNWQQDGMP